MRSALIQEGLEYMNLESVLWQAQRKRSEVGPASDQGEGGT